MKMEMEMEITNVADLQQLEVEEVTEVAAAGCTMTCSWTCWWTSFAA